MNMFPNRRRGVFFNPYEDMMNELLDPYNDFNLSTSELFRISRPMVVPSPTIHRDMPRNQIRRVFRVPIEEGPLHYATSSPVEENTTQTEEKMVQEAIRLSLEEDEARKKNQQEISDDMPILEELSSEEFGPESDTLHPSTSPGPKVELVEDEDDEDLARALAESAREEEERRKMQKQKEEEELRRIQAEEEQLSQAKWFQRRTLLEEQDKAFKESLKVDEEKKRKQEELDNQRSLDEMQSEEEQAIKMSIELNKHRAKDLAANLPPEPEPAPNVTHIVVRTPDGSRLERRFFITDPLQHLKNFIDSKATELHIPDNYELVVSFPTRIFKDFSQTFQQAGLTGRALLNIQQL